MSVTFLSILDYGDIVYMNAISFSSLRMCVIGHSNLLLTAKTQLITLYTLYTLYPLMKWPSLHTRRHLHWNLFIFKSILNLVPSYLSCYFKRRTKTCSLRSQASVSFSVPAVLTELEKKAFSFSGPSSWYMLQQDLKPSSLITLTEFRVLLKGMDKELLWNCCCFN